MLFLAYAAYAAEPSAGGAPEVLVSAPEGWPSPGGRAPVDVAVVSGTLPLEGAEVVVVPQRGRIVASEGEVAPGRYRFRYQASSTLEPDRLEVRVGDAAPAARSLPIRVPPTPAFGTPAEIDAPAGTPRIEVRFANAAPPAPEDLLVRVSEGRVLEVRRDADAVTVVVEPGPDRVARLLAVAVLDGSRPGERPVFGLVRLRARPQFSLTAERGSVASLRVGGRTYGPFVADAGGQLSVTFDAFPGETSWELSVADDLGNTQRSTGPLATSLRPVLLAVEAPLAGEGGSALYLGAWSPTGQTWTGAPPICRSGAGVREDAAWAARGLYSYTVAAPGADGALFDPRVECVLQEATAAARVPVGGDRPDRVELRVYPDALSSDFPIAQVQAALLDARGERLGTEGLEVVADVGELATEVREGMLRAEYRGAAAVERGGDRIRASWSWPPGAGEPWSLRVYATPDVDGLAVLARAFDRGGRPLGGVPIRLAAGDVVAEGVSDDRGWVRARLGWGAPASVVHAEAGAAVAETVVFRGAPEALPDPLLPDLWTAVDLPIRAGRVRQVFIDAGPRPLFTGAGQTAEVVVKMLDAAGNLVHDEPVRITASEGTVSPPEVRDDGALTAAYRPPPGPLARRVEITATSSAGAVSTTLDLVPRPVRGSVALGVGWITDFGSLSAPSLQASVATRLPLLPDLLQARVGVGAWALRATVHDPVADADIDLRATMVPVELGVAAVQRVGLRSVGAGVGVVVAPYQLTVDYGGERGLSGVGISSPGLAVHAGAGWRVGGAELFTEARYYLFTASSTHIAFEGSVGGLSLTAGYRVLY